MASANVKDIELDQFETEVLRESWDRPVVVDFWAPWCAPCRMLSPVLERLADEFHGDFLLAKVNTESNPELAQDFEIRSIPNVKVFREGEVVDELVGAVPEDQARAFIRQHCPTPADRKIQAALEAAARGDSDGAGALLEEVLDMEPEHGLALLELGKIRASAGDTEAASALWDRIPASAAEWEQAVPLKRSLHFAEVCASNGGHRGWEARAAANPDDLEARYALGCCHVSLGRYREALEEFLYVVSKDKNYKDQEARRAMLTVFSLAGERSDLSEEYRKKLAFVLF